MRVYAVWAIWGELPLAQECSKVWYFRCTEPEVGRAEEAGIEYDLEVMKPGLDQDHVQGNNKPSLRR
jgi:hypothetical protein